MRRIHQGTVTALQSGSGAFDIEYHDRATDISWPLHIKFGEAIRPDQIRNSVGQEIIVEKTGSNYIQRVTIGNQLVLNRAF